MTTVSRDGAFHAFNLVSGMKRREKEGGRKRKEASFIPNNTHRYANNGLH